MENHEISDVGVLSEFDLSAVRRIRGRFASVFASSDARAAAGLINELVAGAGTTPRLTDHDGYDWHVHYFAPGASVADHLAADCGMALAFFVVAGEQERLRRCEAPDCRRAFVDLSRKPLAALLRQPYLREPAARGRIPGAPQGSGRLTPPTGHDGRRRPTVSTRFPTGDAGNRGYGSEQQQVVQRSHEQQTPDHRKKDHQRWLGKGEEASARLVLRRRGIALCRVQHLAATMTQPTGTARSTRS
ncbi:hypothetical protein SALBM311S_08401 [Streptomyces alboniger]